MEFGQLMIDILVYVSCKFEMYIFKIAQVISENIRNAFLYVLSIFEPRCEKTGLRGFRPGPTQTGLCSHRKWLEA